MSDLQILIVHASASMRQAIRLALLEDDGLSFCEAENIETAQLMCGIQNFDVVISGRHFDKQNWSHLYNYLRPANAHKPLERFILIGNLGPIDSLRAIFNRDRQDRAKNPFLFTKSKQANCCCRGPQCRISAALHLCFSTSGLDRKCRSRPWQNWPSAGCFCLQGAAAAYKHKQRPLPPSSKGCHNRPCV